MSKSILKSTKVSLGLGEDYTPFDQEILLFINAKLADLNQLGIGPDEGFQIEDEIATWEDFLGDELRYNMVPAYMHLSVRMLFDPPTVGYVITAMKDQLDKMEYRINRAREDLVHPMLPKAVADKEVLITDGSDLDVRATRMSVRAGLPFSRNVRITGGKEVWPNLADFEARMQIRLSKSPTSELLYDFSSHIQKSFDDQDIVLTWTLTGEQTRQLKSGYYDLVVSDAGSTDARAIRAVYGYLYVEALVTT